MHTKKATVDDWQTIADIGRQSWEETFTGIQHYTPELVAGYTTGAFNKPKILSEMADPDCWLYLVSENSEAPPLGYIKLKRDGAPECVKDRNIMGLDRLYFLKKMQGKGLGRKAFEFCLGEAKKMGYPEIWLSVWEHNLPAIGFYEKMGCKRAGSWDWTFEYQGAEVVDLDYIMVCPTGLAGTT